MATTDEVMREAAKKFWGPLKQGKDIVSGDIKISVASRGQYRTIRIGPDDPHRMGIFVAGYWESSDIKLLQLSANGRNGHEDEKIGELLFWIVAEAREPSIGSRLAKPPESITDLITVEYTGEDALTWLLGELYDDRVEIKSTWEPEPFRIGDDIHARWMDGHETWLELSNEPMAEYNRIFRRPIEAEEVAEMPTAESKLDKLQKMIDGIEKDIRQLRAKEKDFTSTNTEIARRLGNQNEYEELLKQRDELMWRENPGKIPEYKVAIDKFYLMQGYKGSVRQAYGRRAGLNYEVEDRTEEVTLKVHRWSVANICVHPKTQDRILSISGWFITHSSLGRKVGEALLRVGEAHGYDILKPLRLGFESRKQTSTYIGKWGKKETSTWDKNVVVLTHDDGRYTIVTDDLPGPHAIESDGWMNPLRFTSINLNEDPKTEYKRLLWSEKPFEEPEVEEIPMATSDLEATQALIDAIELEIRVLRSDERDFVSSDIMVAERLGKREEYERLLKERDEAMWRENPQGRGPGWGRGRDENFDIILRVTSYHGDQSTIDVSGPDGNYTYLLVQVRNGVVLNDETAYGYNSEADALKDSRLPEFPLYFSEGGIPGRVRPNHRNFDLVVRLDSTHDEDTSVEIETAFGATVFAIYTITDGWVDNWQADYGYLAEGPAIQAAGSDDKTLRIYHSTQEGAITPEAGPAVEVSESELDAVQRGIDKIEKMIDTRRKKDNDYKTPALQVAKAVGKRVKYEKLLKRRDEQMWRGNPSAPVIYKKTAHWKNGVTDVQVRKLKNGKFRVIEHCCEGLTPDGTGISKIVSTKEEAVELADWYAANLESRKNPGEMRVITKQDMRKQAKLPKLLYHGTSIQNMHKVLKEGLLVHQPHTPYTVESEHEEDTNLNVSLANTVQDAVFFSLGAAGWGADQAIIEFDTTKMTEEEYPAILRRPLFGKTGRFEYKVYTMRGIPPEHISRVLIRSFEKPAGHLEVTERWYTREEALSLPEPNA